MSRKARTWAAAVALLLLVAGSALAFGQVSGTFAIFNAEVENQNNVLVGGWVPQPTPTGSSLVNSSPYNQVTLTWTAGAAPPVTGQTIKYADGGSSGSASCPAADSGSYGAFSTPATGVGTANVIGTDISHWWCFEISANASSWSTDWLTFTAQRLFVPTGISLNNGSGNNASTMESGDKIVINYNQNVNVGSPISVIACTTTILIGAASCGGSGSLGTLSGASVAHSKTFGTSTVAGSGTGTITITLAGSSSSTAVGGPWSFTAAGTSSGGQNVCTAAACTVSTSTDF